MTEFEEHLRRLLADEASKEQDSAKLSALIAQLCRELDAANGRGRA